MTHPVIATLDHPLSAVRKGGLEKLVGDWTHPVDATLDHPLFAARKEGNNKSRPLFTNQRGTEVSRMCALQNTPDIDTLDRPLCAVRKEGLEKLVGDWTHPVDATLDHPLFAARKEGLEGIIGEKSIAVYIPNLCG